MANCWEDVIMWYIIVWCKYFHLEMSTSQWCSLKSPEITKISGPYCFGISRQTIMYLLRYFSLEKKAVERPTNKLSIAKNIIDVFVWLIQNIKKPNFKETGCLVQVWHTVCFIYGNHKLPHPHAEAQSSSVPGLTHPRALKTSQRNTHMYSCDFRKVILFVFDGL